MQIEQHRPQQDRVGLVGFGELHRGGARAAEILEDEGFAVDVFNDPLAALEALVPGRYAVALLDIKMPKLSGIS